jgi:hypothetical protein
MRFPILTVAVLSIFAAIASLQADEALHIDSPASNETVSGIVGIRGAAAAPGMMRFRVEFGYDPDPTGTWFLILEGTEPVQNGQLAVWDTTSVSEGDYALRLAAYFADGSIREVITRGLRLRRENPPAAISAVEAVTPIAPDTGSYAKPAAAFPAPTADFGTGPAATGDAVPLRGMAFLTGAVLAILGFVLYWLRARWFWWKRRLSTRRVRKSGK